MDSELTSFDYYLKDIQDCNPLSAEEEYETAVLMKTGNSAIRQEMREKLIRHNLRFAIRIAMEFKGRGLPVEDLVSEANVGLCQAADKYQPDRGTRFLTYASFWIRSSIYRSFTTAFMIRIPSAVSPILKKYLELGPDTEKLSDGELAVLLDSTEKTIKAVRNLVDNSNMKSLDQEIGDKGFTYGDYLKDESVDIDESVYESDIREVVRNAVDDLSPREADIIRRRNGLGCLEETLGDIGEDYNRTKERIRQIEKKAMKRLKLRFKGRDPRECGDGEEENV